MKWIKAVVSLFVAGAVFWGLNRSHGVMPPLGKLLNPSAGFWQNGTQRDRLPEEISIPGLKEDVEIIWDSRHVPHIFAKNDHDLYLAQGYVAAHLRLWQMEFLSRFASGRLSEIFGSRALSSDLFRRRFGMVWAAENAVKGLKDRPESREAVSAYAAGVNAYIGGLKPKNLPLEYKFFDHSPEPWTELKEAFILKYMTYYLASYNRDAEMTAMRDALGESFIARLFPDRSPLVEPVIPAGTPFDFVPVEIPERPEGADDVKSESRAADNVRAPASGPKRFPAAVLSPEIGSNNWAVSGKLTESGFPILCNDMHLPLNLPAIWYEIQLNAPGVNAYGSTFPGVPTVVAGFNERAAWGFTNGGSDVLDWYSVSFKDDSREEYLFDGKWRKTTLREERIEVRGGKTVVENVIYTHHGPIVRPAEDPPFDEMRVPADAALRWLGHDPSNEFLTFHILNRAQNYDDYLEAARAWSCPGQNIVYADVDGNIALAHSGLFPLRWKGQGRYLLDASNPSHEWGGWVPKEHNPHVKNPERGFVSSANQIYAGPDYPYYLGWNYSSFERGARINEILRNSESVTPEDMIRMQGDVMSLRARAVLPFLVELVQENLETDAEKRIYDELERWNFEYKAELIAPTIFNRLWRALDRGIWADEMGSGAEGMAHPASQITIDFILNHPDSEFYDDKTTPERESLPDIVIAAYRTAVRDLEDRLGPPGESWEWGKVKNITISHLGRIPGFGRENLITDGDGGVVNAISTGHGPSWKMVVSLEPGIRAWGIYPGGQSGNPGSVHYDDFVEDWVAGKPYELLFLRSPDEDRSEIVRKTTLRGAR